MADAGTRSGMFIDGAWIEPPAGRWHTAVNPASGESIGQFAVGDGATARRAIEAAAAALPAWAGRPAVERSRFLRGIAGLLRERIEPLARLCTLESGKCIRESRVEVQAAAAHFDWYAEEAQRVYGRIVPPAVAGKRHLVLHQPVGVVAAITPWNFPLMLWARKVAPALAAGCTVVSRPATATTLTAMEALKCCIDVELPAGVLNLVTGPAGELAGVFIDSPPCRKITFTGSTQVGVELAARSARTMKRLSLELGGQAPALVLADADLNVAARGVAAGKLRNNGQSCISINRCYVEQAVAEPFMTRLVEEVGRYKVGNGLDESVDLGTLISREVLDKVMAHLADAQAGGARLLCGGERLTQGELARGFFVSPAVLTDVNDNLACMCEETFGPVLPVMVVADRHEAVRRANATPYGLAAYLFTTSTKAAFEVGEALEAGTIGVNDPVPSTTIAPFGGFKMSGLGRECGTEGIEAFLETKHISLVL